VALVFIVIGALGCVSTKGKDPGHAMPPLPYLKSVTESMDLLVRIVREMKRARIVSTTPSYLHLEFRSGIEQTKAYLKSRLMCVQ
jgi:uncharacterized protein (DUF1499 family)